MFSSESLILSGPDNFQTLKLWIPSNEAFRHLARCLMSLVSSRQRPSHLKWKSLSDVPIRPFAFRVSRSETQDFPEMLVFFELKSWCSLIVSWRAWSAVYPLCIKWLSCFRNRHHISPTVLPVQHPTFTGQHQVSDDSIQSNLIRSDLYFHVFRAEFQQRKRDMLWWCKRNVFGMAINGAPIIIKTESWIWTMIEGRTCHHFQEYHRTYLRGICCAWNSRVSNPRESDWNYWKK